MSRRVIRRRRRCRVGVVIELRQKERTFVFETGMMALHKAVLGPEHVPTLHLVQEQVGHVFVGRRHRHEVAQTADSLIRLVGTRRGVVETVH